MKKLIFGSLVLTSALFGMGEFSFSVDTNGVDVSMDLIKNNTSNTSTNICAITPEQQCFDAVDVSASANIQTKNAGAEFSLKITHNPACGINFTHHVSVALIDNETGEIISTPKEVTAEGEVDFKVKNAYKNVSVAFFNFKPVECNFNHGFKWMHQFKDMFEYTKEHHSNLNDILNTPFVLADDLECHKVSVGTTGFHDEVVSCPKDLSQIKQIAKNQITHGFSHSFMYAIPKHNQCYQVSNPCDLDNQIIAKSSDNFAIKPAKFIVTLPTHINANSPTALTVEALNEDGEVIENYNASSTDLKVIFNPTTKAQYGFDIREGKGIGQVNFSETVENVQVLVSDEHFADVDSDDTSSSDRIVSTDSSHSSTATVDNSGSKYWAGAGTNEAENSPTTNTVSADIKQNVTKDFHFQKMVW